MSVSNCEFFKWRCLIAMAHADGIVKESEETFIQEQIGERPFTERQREVLREDHESPKDIKVLYQDMRDEDQKAHLVQLAFQLFWADHDFHEAEQEIFMFLRENS